MLAFDVLPRGHEVSLMSTPLTEMRKFMGEELRENVPAAREGEEVGFTQFLTHKYTLLSILLCLVPPSLPQVS